MTSPAPAENVLATQLRHAAERIQQTITKYEGVLELRERQIAAAAALGSRRTRDENLTATLCGYAADLDRYSSELQPHITVFREACEALRMCYSRSDYRPPDKGAANEAATIRPHTDCLKLARAERDVVNRAKRGVAVASGRPERVNTAVRRHRAVLDEYLRALDVLEGISLDMLAALGADATWTPPFDSRTD